MQYAPGQAAELAMAVLTMRATGVPPWEMGQVSLGRNRTYQAASLLAPALVLAPHMLAVAKMKSGIACPFAGGG